MIPSYRLTLTAENYQQSAFLAEFAQVNQPFALVKLSEQELIFASQVASQAEAGTTVELADESCRLVIQGELALSDLAQISQLIEGSIVRVALVDDLFAKLSMGAVVLGLSQVPAELDALQQLAEEKNWELNLLDEHPSLYKPGVLLMDMDSTAIQIECIDEIAKLAGVGEQVAEVTELAMQGKLDFAESLRGRVATLKGADETILEQVRQVLPMTQGLPELVSALHKVGWKAAIASGGFTYFADYLKDELPLDAAFANVLGIEDGKLTGEVIGGIVDAQKKADVMGLLREEYGIEPGQAVAAGDGANDLIMMAASDMGVAFHAKPVVAAQATTAIRRHGLEGIYYLLASAPK